MIDTVSLLKMTNTQVIFSQSYEQLMCLWLPHKNKLHQHVLLLIIFIGIKRIRSEIVSEFNMTLGIKTTLYVP